MSALGHKQTFEQFVTDVCFSSPLTKSSLDEVGMV